MFMLLKHVVGWSAAAVLLGIPAAASAQMPTWQRPGDTARYRAAADAQFSYYEARRIAYDQGYREGLARGEADARRGRRYGYQNIREYERADKGYHRSMGERDRYRQIFRDGFAAGYSEGYGRAARYGRNVPRQAPYPQTRPGVWGPSARYGYSSPAFDNGARDGYEKGLEDARKNRSFDPVRHSWYRSGDRHYQSRYGSRDQYKDLYRRGFQQGYERGYSERRYR